MPPQQPPLTRPSAIAFEGAGAGGGMFVSSTGALLAEPTDHSGQCHDGLDRGRSQNHGAVAPVTSSGAANAVAAGSSGLSRAVVPAPQTPQTDGEEKQTEAEATEEKEEEKEEEEEREIEREKEVDDGRQVEQRHQIRQRTEGTGKGEGGRNGEGEGSRSADLNGEDPLWWWKDSA